ncbi:MAG TPA: hypothetical protein VH120_05895, partial [Gemmataceae bacterium]|nr:hypothetical protein [Gemmataceae bacterium]
MSKQRARGWYRSLFARRFAQTGTPPAKVRLELLTFEEKALPSISIPLNGFTWTHVGPSPIAVGQGPGSPPSTGRINDIAVDPNTTGSDTLYVASDSGGIWRTTDDGQTWSPRTDTQQMYMQAITMIHRTGGNTVYAFDQLGNFYVSLDGGTTFSQNTDPFGLGGNTNQFGAAGPVVNKLLAVAVDPTDPTQDILYAAVGSGESEPPSLFPGAVFGSGIWRSTDGGATWANIVDSTAAPFSSGTTTIPANSLSFTDVAVDPTNSNVVYAAIGNTFGDPTNGVYRSTNALSASPTWSLLIGGSAFVPGENPGNIKLAISPTQPSTVFASLALRTDPQTGFAPLLGVFRTQDAGTNWAPVLLANPNSPVNDPNNYMDIFGDDNNFIAVAPNGSTDPNQQTVYVGGFGSTLNATVLISTNSGASWTPIGIGANGIGTYPNIHDGGFDSQGRLVVATGGGVYRLDSTAPVTWVSLNGTTGPTALDVSQFNGFALNPTNADQAVGNVSFSGDLAFNAGPSLHNALFFADNPGAGDSAYGWQTVDANGFDGYVGSGQVIYNPFNPNIVYRVAPGNNGQNQFIRRST